MTLVFDTPQDIAFVQLAARVAALKVEIHTGMRRSNRGRSAYSIIKSEYGFRGSRERVLELAQERIEYLIAERRTLELLDVDQGNCPDDHDCHLERSGTTYPILRVCSTIHNDDMIHELPFRAMPLVRLDITAAEIDAAAAAGAWPRYVEWARSALADR